MEWNEIMKYGKYIYTGMGYLKPSFLFLPHRLMLVSNIDLSKNHGQKKTNATRIRRRGRNKNDDVPDNISIKKKIIFQFSLMNIRN